MRNSYWDDIRQSLYNVIDHKLLEQGAYVNIATGEKNVRGDDLSTLYPVVDNEFPYPSGHIWQSAFPNWVYESGVSNQPSPIVCSGVYINGVFTPKSSNVHVDFLNGRIILGSAISTSSTVKAAFSYKEYSFVHPEENVYSSTTRYKSNSKINTSPFAADPSLIYLPAIFIDIDSATEVGFQLGGTHETLPNFKLTLVGDNQAHIERLASTITFESTRSFPIVSANNGPKFDYFHDIYENYSFSGWCTLSDNFAFIKSVKYGRFYDSKAENSDPALFGGVINLEISAIR